MAELIFVDHGEQYALYYLQESIHYGGVHIIWPRPDGSEHRLGGLIKKGVSEEMGYVQKDWINDRPYLEITETIEFTDGTTQRNHLDFKLKTKPFTRNPVYVDEIAMSAVVVPLKTDSASGRLRVALKEKEPDYISPLSLEHLFSFQPTIDLHADQLDISTKGKTNGQIVDLQLAAFKDWLEQAIRLDVSPLVVIHGVGSGMLRKRVQQLLIKHPEVKRFENSYDPRYGHGATKIVLK